MFEIVEELGAAPDAFVIPYGGGGNTSAYAAGISRARALDADLLGRGGAPADHPRIGDPDRRSRARRERARLGRHVVTVSDDEIVAAWLELASLEGLFCEPSSAAGLAAIRRGDVPGERLAVTITGHGLKDSASADRYAPALAEVDADPDAIAAAARS